MNRILGKFLFISAFLAAFPCFGANSDHLFKNFSGSDETIFHNKWKFRLENIIRRMTYSEPDEDDQARDVTDQFDLQTLEAMQARGLTAGRLSESPWSGDYWPIYSGMIAKRYADPDFPSSMNWKDNSEYILGQLKKQPQASSLDLLSPAEKYDLLIGDEEFTLTKAMLKAGEAYFNQYGQVEFWMGLCHGWAAASYMMPRPSHSIEITAADGRTRLVFYPADIKALASLLWANAQYEVKSIGKRCNRKDPRLDPIGRVVDEECLDNNPGTWHMAVINQIGVSDRSLIMDTAFDFQVWNQPIYSYRYTYLNPKTQKAETDLSKAKVLLSDFPNDPYHKFRSKNAVALVGIQMNLTYIVETAPNRQEMDSPESDATRTVTYDYDLELNADGKIVGGEWHRNFHPDFLWTPAIGTRAVTPGDESLEREGRNDHWDGKKPMSKRWKNAAIHSSQFQLPLGKIVEALVILSNVGVH